MEDATDHTWTHGQIETTSHPCPRLKRTDRRQRNGLLDRYSEIEKWFRDGVVVSFGPEDCGVPELRFRGRNRLESLYADKGG